MNTVLSPSLLESLQEATRLAQSVETYPQAQATFAELYEQVETSTPEAAELLKILWREYISAQRSAIFWQELCQVEKHLSERLSESHLQLKQNYLRLMQER